MGHMFCLHHIFHNFLLVRNLPLHRKLGKNRLRFSPSSVVIFLSLEEDLTCKGEGKGGGLGLGEGEEGGGTNLLSSGSGLVL